MLLFFETLGLCLLFWLLCYVGTGSDEKNVKSFRSYPDPVQKMLQENKALRGRIPKGSPLQVFVSNVILFSLILFLLGIPLAKPSFLENFLNILIMGQVLNAFDFFIMDLLWFRRSRRTRFEGTKDRDDLYRDPKNHFAAFLRGIPAFLVTALIDGWILTLI